MHRVRVIAPAGVISFALAACSLTVGLDNLTGGAGNGDAADGSTNDATGVSIAPDASSPGPTDDASSDGSVTTKSGDDASRDAADDVTGDVTGDGGGDDDAGGMMTVPSDLVPNGGFETENGVGCGPDWSGYFSTITGIERPRTGVYACLICNNYAIQTSSPTFLDGGPNAVISGYARLVAADGSDAGYVATPATCNAGPDGGPPVCGTIQITGTSLDGSVGNHVDNPAGIGTDWSRFGEEFGTSNVQSVTFDVEFANVPSGDCVLMDDVTITYQN